MEDHKEAGDIFHHIDRRFDELMSIQKESLALLNFQNQLAMHGIEGIKERLVQDIQGSDASRFRERISDIVRNDSELRYPHTKILDYLAGLFDFDKNHFKEVHFSKLVRECRIGKNKAKGYLDLLVAKGLVESRSDGYRVFYRIKQSDI